MQAAKRNRDFRDKLIQTAFQGSQHLRAENFVRLTYCFQERRADCGTVIADELALSNQCLVIKSGQCSVFKKKNVVKPFLIWRDSLDEATR
jgi:hypothetical protein